MVGLAPGRTGANRTGLPFRGDESGTLLWSALQARGLDGPRVRVTNAVRCLPPGNRPTGAERRACSPFLERELGELLAGGRRRSRVAILALGRFAHDAVVAALGRPGPSAPFTHGAAHVLSARARLVDSYHCSRYNVRTGRLTPAMFHRVVGDVRCWLADGT